MDRKALKRQYKETRHPMGVYRVHNTVNGKSLLGASVNVSAALNRHLAQLRLGVHPNRQLQLDWNQTGADAFKFEVLDTLTPPDRQDYDPSEDLEVLEHLWLEKTSPYAERGYHEKPRTTAQRGACT
jgi:hypothetical protein